MTKQEFMEFVQKKILILDGATGSNLQKRGMPANVCPELWISENENPLISLQQEYAEAGSDIVYAPTFTANRIKLKEYGLEGRTEELNEALIHISKKTPGILVTGDVTMTGQQLAPLGTLSFDTLVSVYEEQIQALDRAGADLLVIETMMSLQETRAALLAAKKVSKLPVMVSMSFGEDGRTIYGTDAVTAAVVLQSLGADAVGMNCSSGPDKMIPLVKQMREVLTIPLIAKPNAGMPKMGKDGNTEYDMDAENFVHYMTEIIKEGADIIGGCCGTSPEYIKKLSGLVKDTKRNRWFEGEPCRNARFVTSERKTVELAEDVQYMEINSTMDEELAKDLQEGEFDAVYDLIDDASEEDTVLLNLNVDGCEGDGGEIMKQLIAETTGYTTIPHMFESADSRVLETALRNYPGRACINSRSGKQEELKRLADRYGACLI